MPNVAIITGASSGIGHGLAIEYAKAGYALGLMARRTNRLTAIKESLEADYGVHVEIQSCDVSDRGQVDRSMAHFMAHFSTIDVLIVNAGVSFSTPAHQPKTDHFNKTIATNLLGAGYCAYAMIPNMIRQRSGHIAVISSLAGYRGLPEAGAYCASKAGVNALFESMRLDLKKFGINVSIIRPGFIKSAMTDRNQFYMPCLQSTQQGVIRIFKAIQKKSRIMAFPFPLALVVRTFYWWPCWLYDAVMAGRRHKKT